MNKTLLHILQHSLGVDEYGRGTQFRNHFCAGGADVDLCRELVALGYMQEHPPRSFIPDPMFSVTTAGKKAMWEESPKPPRLSKGQLRYRAWLGLDNGMTFGEFLKAERSMLSCRP